MSTLGRLRRGIGALITAAGVVLLWQQAVYGAEPVLAGADPCTAAPVPSDPRGLREAIDQHALPSLPGEITQRVSVVPRPHIVVGHGA